MFAINTLLLIAVLAVAGRHICASPAHDRKALRPHEPRPEHFDPSLPEPHHVFELHPIDPALRRRQRRRQLRAAEMAPLFPGYGTHYVYAYVGTPPQRQSLIVDTGSHFTAFPCTGCKQCGEHTDPYWDVKKSTSAALPRCATKDQTCQVTQSYTEGSSWHGFKVQDTLWLGGEKAHLLPNAPDYAVNFTFACQTEETGLFRTQLADGIMGMSAAPDTLPNVLAAAKVTDSRVFALCYRNGGGIFTLGGVRQEIHAKRKVAYAAMEVRQGWYGVTLVNVRFIDPQSGVVTELAPSTRPLFAYAAATGASSSSAAPSASHRLLQATGNATATAASEAAGRRLKKSKPTDGDKAKPPASTPAAAPSSAAPPAGVLNSGRGVIVDSGTTDTYLPAALAEPFRAAFKAAARGIVFSTGNIPLTPAQIATLPDIAFDLLAVPSEGSSEGGSGGGGGSAEEVVTVRMPVASYLDSVGDGKFTFRVYLTEKSGAVLGANFMSDANVVFDVDGRRVGFVRSTCNFEEFNAPLTNAPTAPPTLPPAAAAAGPIANGNGSACGFSQLVPYTQCSARCDRADEAAYVATGTQDFVASCVATQALLPAQPLVSRGCSENCTKTLAVRGDPRCPDSPWTECSHACITTRRVVPRDTEPLFRPLVSHGSVSQTCNYQTQTSACYTGQCPRQDGDYLLYVDVHLRMDAARWSYVHAESFFVAFASLFHLPSPHHVELLNHYNADEGSAGGGARAALRLHFQIRLKRRDVKTEQLLHARAEAIVTTLRSADFPRLCVAALDEVAQVQDRATQRRFGWLYPQDLRVLSAVAVPLGDARSPVALDGDGSGSGSGGGGDGREEVFLRMTVWELLLLGAALGVLAVLGVVVYLHVKLREEYALLSKDKSTLARSGRALRTLWNRFASMAAAATGADSDGAAGRATGSNMVLDLSAHGGGGGGGGVSEQQRAYEVELSRRGLMAPDEDDDLDDDDDVNG
eukprot:gene9970-7131_t